MTRMSNRRPGLMARVANRLAQSTAEVGIALGSGLVKGIGQGSAALVSSAVSCLRSRLAREPSYIALDRQRRVLIARTVYLSLGIREQEHRLSMEKERLQSLYDQGLLQPVAAQSISRVLQLEHQLLVLQEQQSRSQRVLGEVLALLSHRATQVLGRKVQVRADGTLSLPEKEIS